MSSRKRWTLQSARIWVSEWITGGSCCNMGYSKTRERQNSSTWFLPASTPRHHMDPQKRAPYRSKIYIERPRKQRRLVLVLGEQTLLRSRKFLWSQPPVPASLWSKRSTRTAGSLPLNTLEETKGMVTTRVEAEDRLPNRGCAGGVMIVVTRSHSCRLFLRHEECEFLCPNLNHPKY
jgi:hypothetical protein